MSSWETVLLAAVALYQSHCVVYTKQLQWEALVKQSSGWCLQKVLDFMKHCKIVHHCTELVQQLNMHLLSRNNLWVINLHQVNESLAAAGWRWQRQVAAVLAVAL